MGAIEYQVDKVTSNYKRILEILFVSFVCGIIFICFCIPIIIYATSSDVTPIADLEIDDLDIDNCSQQVSREYECDYLKVCANCLYVYY